MSEDETLFRIEETEAIIVHSPTVEKTTVRDLVVKAQIPGVQTQSAPAIDGGSAFTIYPPSNVLDGGGA
jgi:hypothetical protein